MKKKTLVIVAIVLAVLLAALVGGGLWLKNNHVFVGMKPYPNDATYLDLRGKDLSVGEFEQLCQLLPDCKVDWDVPFQEGRYPSNTRTLTIRSISNQEIAQLRYFPELEAIDASACQDYDLLMQLRQTYPDVALSYGVIIDGTSYPQDAAEVTVATLTEQDAAKLAYLPQLTTLDARNCVDYEQLTAVQQKHPELEVLYNVTIGGETYSESTTELTLQNPDMAELTEKLAVLTNLQTVHLVEPDTDAASLTGLQEAYPEINVSWEITIRDQKHHSAETEVDLSGLVISTDEVEAAMAYFPNAEKVIMNNPEIDNDTMAAFRDKMRPQYKVVWTVMCRTIPVRTDEVFFHPYQHEIYNVFDNDVVNLKYCEDMICVDLGHNSLHHCDWAAYMPNLKYLILAWNIYLDDISGLSNCDELVYIELGWTQVRDFTPLLGCTKLEDLHLKYVYSDPGVICEMKWLKNIFWEGCKPQYHSKLLESLPDTYILLGGENSQTKQWRKLDNYYAQRDVLGMGYMDQY